MHAMTRRWMALVLLLIAAGSSISQGLTVVLCHCSGDVFVGHVPEACCEECPEREAAADSSKEETGKGITHCLTARGECFTVISKGWENYPPVVLKDGVPAPSGLEFCLFGTPVDFDGVRDPVWSRVEWRQLNRAGPPGRSRTLLHVSLRI